VIAAKLLAMSWGTRLLTAVVVFVSALALAAPALAKDPPATTWQTNGRVRAIAFSGGVMYFGGSFTSVRPTGASGPARARQNAAAIDVASGRLLPWNPHPNGQVFSIAISGRTAFVGGTFSKIGGARRANLARVGLGIGTAKGWNPGTNATVDVARIGPNGNLFVGGQFTRVAGRHRSRIASFKPSGRLGTWAPRLGQISGSACPPRCHPVVFSIAFSPNHDSVYIGGHFGLVNGVARNEAAKVPINSGGTTLRFNPDIYAAANCPTCTTVETSRVYNIIPKPGRIYTCGGYWKVNGNQQSYNVSSFNPRTGKLQTSFRGEDDGDTVGCAIRKNVMYVGGHFNVAGFGCTPAQLGNCSTRHHVAAFDAATGHVLAWNPDANSVHGLLVITPSEHAVGFGGYFTRMGGTNSQGIALYRHLPKA
jgi:hypothetical protein